VLPPSLPPSLLPSLLPLFFYSRSCPGRLIVILSTLTLPPSPPSLPPSLPPSGTQKWLQRYVYFRNSESLLITYFVSAFWHGFYPG